MRCDMGVFTFKLTFFCDHDSAKEKMESASISSSLFPSLWFTWESFLDVEQQSVDICSVGESNPRQLFSLPSSFPPSQITREETIASNLLNVAAGRLQSESSCWGRSWPRCFPGSRPRWTHSHPRPHPRRAHPCPHPCPRWAHSLWLSDHLGSPDPVPPSVPPVLPNSHKPQLCLQTLRIPTLRPGMSGGWSAQVWYIQPICWGERLSHSVRIECEVFERADFEAEIENLDVADDHYAAILPLRSVTSHHICRDRRMI